MPNEREERSGGEWRGGEELITIHARSTYGVGGDFITFRSALRGGGRAVFAHFRFRVADLRLRYAHPKSSTNGSFRIFKNCQGDMWRSVDVDGLNLLLQLQKTVDSTLRLLRYGSCDKDVAEDHYAKNTLLFVLDNHP